jgi:hypothetical protein
MFETTGRTSPTSVKTSTTPSMTAVNGIRLKTAWTAEKMSVTGERIAGITARMFETIVKTAATIIRASEIMAGVKDVVRGRVA